MYLYWYLLPAVLIYVIWLRLSLLRIPNLSEWYIVRFDAWRIYREVSPMWKKPWSDSLMWNDIERICFKVEKRHRSDEIIIFTNQRKESYVIPTGANGGYMLWIEILKRELFDRHLAIKAMESTGGLFCWPPLEEKK